MSEPMRLQRYLARAGIASRRHAEELIQKGLVSVNGRVVTALGTQVVPGKDRILFDNREVHLPEEHKTLMVYKPSGYLTSMSDPFQRPCVVDLKDLPRIAGLFPVGRLDQDTSGLLLMTTDGLLGDALLHPRKEVSKTYLACIDGQLSSEDIHRLEQGIDTDAWTAAPARVGFPSKDDPRLPSPMKALLKQKRMSVVELTIHEGRNHQVKLMLEACNHPVRMLHRSSFAGLELSGLKPGQCRVLSASELAHIAAYTT